jgi:hypothetical protein
MSREIMTHKGGILNDAIRIWSSEIITPGGASRSYTITRPGMPDKEIRNIDLLFQDGNPANGINGISNEALLAIVQDRLEGFQAGPFVCNENGVALSHVKAAMFALHERTKSRLNRGVEGKQEQ